MHFRPYPLTQNNNKKLHDFFPNPDQPQPIKEEKEPPKADKEQFAIKKEQHNQKIGEQVIDDEVINPEEEKNEKPYDDIKTYETRNLYQSF